MKKVCTSGIALILVLLMLLLAGCESDTGSDETEAETDTVASVSSEVDITGYKLMRSDVSSDEVRDSYVLVKKMARELCGVELEVGTDYKSEDPANRTEKEMIIGHTNLPEENAVYETLAEGEYEIKQSGSKINIGRAHV